MEVEQIRGGLWRWTAPHPDWKENSEGWERDVGCVYYEGPDAVVLIDPLVPAGEEDRFWAALDRDVERANRPVVVLRTVHWHQRSIDEVVAHYPDARFTNAESGPLPAGVEAHRMAKDELIFWIPEHRALVPGDVLLGTDDGGVQPCPDSWLPEGTTGEDLRDSLRSLLELPIDLVLLSHGRPVLTNGREVLAAALE